MNPQFSICNRINDEVAFSHAIRTARWYDLLSAFDVYKQIYNERYPHFLMPSSTSLVRQSESDSEATAFLKSATDFSLRINLGGVRTWRSTWTYWDHLIHLEPVTGMLGFCSECAHEQVRDFGVSFWKTDHALPGVATCLEHNMTLVRVPWQEALRGRGILPHEIRENESRPETNLEARRITEIIYYFKASEQKYCPYSIATAAALKVNPHLQYRSWGRVIESIVQRVESYFSEHLISGISCDYYAQQIAFKSFAKKEKVVSYLTPVFVALSTFESLEEFITHFPELE